MIETLEHLIARAADHPRAPRGVLYKELLRSETFLLCVDQPLQSAGEVRVSRGPRDFAVWADRDAELGGVWVPLFPAKDDVEAFVRSRGLRPPRGKEFLWMEHPPREVFRILRGVRYFAGVRLYLNESTQVPVAWSLVRELSEGRLPAPEPERYELPVSRLVIPEGMRIAYGRVALGGDEGEGRLLCLPAAGHFNAEDMRKLVRLDLGSHGTVWMACRHFLQVLRYLHKETPAGASAEYVQDILRAFMGFEMYGEAEALCEWLAHKGDEAFAWLCLAAVYGRISRFAECVSLCRKGVAKYPKERAFFLNGAKALAAMKKMDEAREFAREGLKAFPGDEALQDILKGF